jgi:hypothetical protein
MSYPRVVLGIIFYLKKGTGGGKFPLFGIQSGGENLFFVRKIRYF